MTADRQYFDSAEGAPTTDIVKVSVDKITCLNRVRISTASAV